MAAFFPANLDSFESFQTPQPSIVRQDDKGNVTMRRHSPTLRRHEENNNIDIYKFSTPDTLSNQSSTLVSRIFLDSLL
jgi:hypothetical protein